MNSKNTKKALRRHHLRRMKARALYRCIYVNYHFGLSEDKIRHFVNKTANNMAICSCCTCGNPRRHFGWKTKAEMASDLSFQEQLDEIQNTRMEAISA